MINTKIIMVRLLTNGSTVAKKIRPNDIAIAKTCGW